MKQNLDDFYSTSKATIVSVCNFPIVEKKTGLLPPDYIIPEAPFGDISFLPLDDAFFFVYIDDARGSMRSITPALRVANSVVQDFINAQLGKDIDAEPGLFTFGGMMNKEEIKGKFAEEILAARKRHTRWCERLVAIADDSWTSNQRRAAVSDLSRFAAKFLKIDRPWISVAPALPAEIVQYKNCPVCYENVHPNAIVCRSCKTVLDKKKYEEIQKVA